MKKKMRRIIAGVLTFAMIMGLLASLSFADDDADELELSLLGLMEYIAENEDDEFTSAQVSDAKKAVAWLNGTSEKASWYDSYVELGEESTSWENLLYALTYMDAVNGIRSENNQSELGISLQSMAGAALNCFYSGNIFTHSGVYYISCENLARKEGKYTGGDTVDTLGYPFTSWYTSEKAVYDAAAENDEYLDGIRYQAYSVYSYNSSLYSSTGHYLNLIWSSLKSFGIATGSGVTVYSGSTSSASFTVEEFKALVAKYEALVNCSQGNHTWDDGEVTTEATCTEEGVMTYTCTVCGDTYTESIEKIAHSYDEGTVTQEASCTAEGEITYTCTVCGDVYTESIEMLDHTFSDLETTVYPTCEDEGTTSRTCTVCGYTETEEIAATGHTWNDEYTIDVEATCTTDGSKSIHCSVCDATKDSEVIAAYGHSYDEGVVTKEATCTEEGEITYTCTTCGATYTASIAMVSHSYDEGVVTKEATCTEEGEIIYTCTVCGETKTESVDMIDHSYDEGTVTTQATCTEEGEILYTCAVCGATTTETIEATGHSYEVTDSLDATETEDGYVTYTCSVCGDTYTEVIAALGTQETETDEETTTTQETTEDSEETTESSGDAAATGDENNLLIWLALAALAGLCLTVTGIRKKVR